MDLQTRKLNLISFLAQLQDENLFEKVESLIFNKNSNDINDLLKPFTESELKDRIAKSEEEYQNGNFKTQEELIKISENW